MSLQGFQSALAYAIRFYDEDKRKSLDEMVVAYQLTLHEKNTLYNLVNQQRVKAYSEEMYVARWRIINGSLGFLRFFIDCNQLKKLWENDFEPKHLDVTYEDLVLRFAEYLVIDPVGYRFITTNTKEFLPDIMRYIHHVFTFNHNWLPKPYQLPENTLLTDRYFRILNLDYDVRELCVDFLKPQRDIHIHEEGQGHSCSTNTEYSPPPVKKLTLLFIAEDVATEFRTFEIDPLVENFVRAQLRDGHNEAIPSCYDQLVEIGLCKELAVAGKKQLVHFH